MTSISIALATYNGERFLSHQLESILCQSRLPDELVVSDDGSSDSTLDLVQGFAKRAPFDVVILSNNHRAGYRANFMRCAERCTGDLIAFCDQDDLWYHDKLAKVEAAFSPTTLLLQHDFHVIDANGQRLVGGMDSIGLSQSEPWARVLGLVQVFHRSLLEYWPLWPHSVDHNQSTERMAHDQWVYFLAHTLDAIQVLNEPLLSYRQHESNTCGVANFLASHDRLRPNALLWESIQGRSQKLNSKRQLIYEGLGRHGPAAHSRALMIKGIILQTNDVHRKQRLETLYKFYSQYSSYCDKRAQTYSAKDFNSACNSIVSCLPKYLERGSRGCKDLVLDTALNLSPGVRRAAGEL